MICPICNLIIEEDLIYGHVNACLDDNEEEQYEQNYKIVHYVEPTLTSSQKKALDYSCKKAKIHSKQTRGVVLTRFVNMGYTENDLNDVLNYIQFNCDVTINCPTKILTEHIINSPHFKNGYESGRCETYLNARTTWENNLFNNAYMESAIIERPKYGALNLLKFVSGSAPGYGKSYFILKPEVKNRITFVNGDSSLQMFHICTFTDPVALLVHLSDQYISNIMNVVKGNKNTYSHTNYKNTYSHTNYIECQIHGLLRLNMDFKKLYLCEKECTEHEINNVKQFCEANYIEFELI